MIKISRQYRYTLIKLKIGSHELLTKETMKLLGSSENKTTKDKKEKMRHIVKLRK